MAASDRLSVVQSCPLWLPRTQRWLYEQVRSLPSLVRSHVACESTANLDELGVPDLHVFADEPALRRLPDHLMRRLRLRRHLSFLVRVARGVDARIIHSHFGMVGWADRGAAAQAGARHVVTFYGADISQTPASDPRWRARYRALFQSVDRVLCEGPHMRRCAITLGCPPHKALVHHLGIDLDRIPFAPRSPPSAGPLRVLLAGTFREKKGLPFALRALGALAAQHRVELAVTLIGDAAGKPGDAEEKARILEELRLTGLSSRCRMLGFVSYDALMREASEHHVFLSPSVTAADGDTEGGAPVSIIEMAASGMPVVSTTHCDIPNILTDRVSGLLAPERDVPALVERLAWLAAHPEGWRSITAAARARVERAFDCRTQGELLGSIYRELVAAR